MWHLLEKNMFLRTIMTYVVNIFYHCWMENQSRRWETIDVQHMVRKYIFGLKNFDKVLSERVGEEKCNHKIVSIGFFLNWRSSWKTETDVFFKTACIGKSNLVPKVLFSFQWTESIRSELVKSQAPIVDVSQDVNPQ